MKKSRFTEEQVAFALRQAESGVPIVEVCRKMGVSEQTFYRWKNLFAGMGLAEVRRLRAECLNENWFMSPDDARERVAAWRAHYNDDRPLSGLGNLAPREFAASTGGWHSFGDKRTRVNSQI